jgi:predicted site-specific integrase-resolvase
MNEYLTPRETAKLLQVTTRTLTQWHFDGKLDCFRTKGNHKRYAMSDIKKLMSSSGEPTGRKICYCRVSTSSQKEDLERQVEFFKREYDGYDIITDIGSGLNWKRKGLQTILDGIKEGNISEIVVTHRDRLCRFGFELIEGMLERCCHGKIVVLNKEETSPEKELVNDLILIITVFSSRLYGLRNHSLKRKIKDATKNNEIQTLSDPTGEEQTIEGHGDI